MNILATESLVKEKILMGGSNSGSVFVIFQQTEELHNILGVHSDVQDAYACLLAHVPRENLVLSSSDMEAMFADNCSTIASKMFDPEVRVARCLLDSGGETTASA